MEEHYLQLRAIHMGAATLSILLLLLRGLSYSVIRARWARSKPSRWLSHGVNGTLVAAAVLLSTVIQQFPLTHPWLTVKLLLLLAYLLLGHFAVNGLSASVRWLALGGAILIFGFVGSVAHSHDPLGFFA